MKTKYLFLAALSAIALTSCTSEDFVGLTTDNSPTTETEGSIMFGFEMPNATRADIAGTEAANLLGGNFYVEGTKGTEPDNSPTTTVVFDNYLVHWGANTAGTTESNTANWEYVGVTPGEGSYADWVKLGTYGNQTIKYWDYSQPQYDFLAFSTGTFKAVAGTSNAANEIGVTKIATGTTLATTAYTFDVPSVTALENTFITDIQEVLKANYGKEVTLKFKNLGAKVRIALYETVPGYAVKDVVFYKVDGTKDFTDGDSNPSNDGDFKSTTAALISADTYGFPHDASIAVSFPHIGVNNSPDAQNPNTPKTDYNKASATVTPVTANSQKWQEFSTLHNFAATKEATTLADGSYIGRTLPTATFAGSAAANYYQTVFPVSDPSAITLRVDYTLVSIDGSTEEIHVYGAKAVVPSTYTKWLPNYAYTYIFKINDNTNGWTSPDANTDGTDPGLFPITFDAVVAERTDANAEQTTITTVSAPTITTYQQNHNPNKDGKWLATNEYSIDTGKDIYVQVMDNSTTSATLKGDLGATIPGESNIRSLLYVVPSTGKTYTSQPTDWPNGYYANADCTTAASGTFSTSTTYYKPRTEAEVMDALQNRTTALNENDVTGRNGITLTKNANISANFEKIENGVDDNPIGITAGQAAKIAITAAGFATGTYAYVYDYSTDPKTTTVIYHPITASSTLANGVKYITKESLDGISTKTSDNEAVISSCLYFSKTTNGSGTTTYSYVSVDGKKTLSGGLIKVDISNDTYLKTSDGNVSTYAFAFETYQRNTGKYAVKVIKVVP